MKPKNNAVYLIKHSATNKVVYTADRSANVALGLQASDSELGALQGWRFISVEGEDTFQRGGSPELISTIETDPTFRIVPYGAEHLCLTSFPGGTPSTELKEYNGLINQHWKVLPISSGVQVQLYVWSNGSNLERLTTNADSTVATTYWKDGESHIARRNFELEEVTPKAVPSLSGGEGVHLTLAATDFGNYFKAEGTKSAVMVFIDFPDTKTARGESTITNAVSLGNQLVGPNNEAAKLFSKQSNNKFTISIDVKSDIGWIDLDANSSTFLNGKYMDITRIKSAVTTKLASTAGDGSTESTVNQVNFDNYDMTFIVIPKEAADLNPNSSLGWSPSYTAADAIVFGADAYETFYAHLVHEVGHQLGLPDLYPSSSVGDVLTEEHKEAGLAHGVGCWSNMACMLNSLSFLGWERHKLGWLDASSKLFLGSPPDNATKYTLTPLTEDNGIAMIMLPIDNAASPSKVFVIEIAQDSYGIVTKDGKKVIKTDTSGAIAKNPNTGVLIYTVDAKVRSGHLPILIVPRKYSISDEYQELWEAPFQVGGSKEYVEGDFKVKVSVDQKVGAQYVISISKVVDDV